MMKFSLFLLTFTMLNISSHSYSETLKIDLNDLPNQIIKNSTLSDDKILKSDLNLTNIIAFVREWKDNNKRKKELSYLYSKVLPIFIKKYPKVKEFHLSTYMKIKDNTKNLSSIIITKEELNKINWNNIFTNNDTRLVKEIYFKNI